MPLKDTRYNSLRICNEQLPKPMCVICVKSFAKYVQTVKDRQTAIGAGTRPGVVRPWQCNGKDATQLQQVTDQGRSV